MCGLAGIVRIHAPGAAFAPELPGAWLDILDEGVRSRGPDGHGRLRMRLDRPDGGWLDVALVHRRLSVLDHEGGAQPMTVLGGPAGTAHNGQVACPACGPGVSAVIFNGCLYNHRALRAELEDAGHRFHSGHSDTEVLLHGWHAWGSRLRERIDGMYAAVVCDGTRAVVAAVRDRFGEKPLYVLDLPEHALVAFASAPGPLAELARRVAGASALEPLALAAWIARGHLDHRTPWRRVTQVPPGGARTVPAPQAVAPTCEPAPPGSRPGALPRELSREDLLDRFDALVGTAVSSRLDADVPLACLLSGGVDSSLVAAHAMHTAGALRTICVRVPGAGYDESDAAAAVARHIGSGHLTVDVDPHPARDLVRLIETLGLPFGDSSLLPTYWAFRAAREHAKVVLTGDGGDELFLGYERHAVPGLAPVLLSGVARPLAWLGARALSRRDPRSRRAKAARLADSCLHGAYADLVAIFPTAELGRLLPGTPAPEVIGYEMRAGARRWRGFGTLDARRVDLEVLLPSDMLRKVDTASMLAGVESRAPLLARALADAALQLPARTLRLGGRRKGLLRAIAARRLPAAVVNRPKSGFAVPIGDWFRRDVDGLGTLLRERLLDARAWRGLDLGISPSPARVERLIAEHMSGVRDHAQRLYMLLVLSIWAHWWARTGEATPGR